MKEIYFFPFKGIFYCHYGRMISYFIPNFVKRNQRRFTLVDKHRFFSNGSFKYFYAYL